MRGIAERQHAGAEFLGSGDGSAHGVGGHALAVAAAGVDHQQGAGVEHRLGGLVGNEQAFVQQPDIGRQHADAVAVMAGEVGADEVVGDLGGFAVLTAHAAGDQVGDGFQCVRAGEWAWFSVPE